MPQPAQRRTRNKPCAKCRERHLKCDGGLLCTNCKKHGYECEPAKGRIRFRPVITTLADSHSASAEGLSHVSPESATRSVSEENREGPSPPPPLADYGAAQAQARRLSHSGYLEAINLPTIRSIVHEESSDLTLPGTWPAPKLNLPEPPHSPPSRRQFTRAALNHQPQESVGVGSSACTRTCLPLQEACLVRCFVEKLAYAFDTTDRFHHYANTVPIFAMNNPLLLNAICTAAARYLYQVCSRRYPGRPIKYNGIVLPELTEESALYYHNVCISHLMDASANPSGSGSTDVLIATTILRYHEQVDTHFTRSDSETYTNAARTIFQAQKDLDLRLLDFVFGRSQDTDVLDSASSSLQVSACLIALRQEIWAVLIYRRPFCLPVSLTHDNYTDFVSTRSLDVYDWTNRILVWCIHVLKICFPDDTMAGRSEGEASTEEQAAALELFEQMWDTHRPAVFDPLYCQQRDPAKGRYFPQIWLSNECQVMGLQHIEFGRIVLAAHKSSFQRIGIGAGVLHRAQENIFRESTRTICGLALSNSTSQPAMVAAGLAITMCGEYFTDAGEQAAILDLLETLSKDHAWPTNELAENLVRAWSLEKDGGA